MTFDPAALLPLIVCPKSHAPLVHEGQTLVSTDPETRLQYEIRDGIPVLLIDEARELSVETWSDMIKRHGRDPATGQAIKSTNGRTE